MGVVVGDVDNDLDADVYLSGMGPNALYLNDGSGVSSPRPMKSFAAMISVSATFADVDHDGDLDLYVANYVDSAPAGREMLWCRPISPEHRTASIGTTATAPSARSPARLERTGAARVVSERCSRISMTTVTPISS